MFKSILIPTDGSEFCERAIEHGIALAKLMGARVVGVTVLAPLHSGAPRGIVPEHLKQIIHEQTEKIAADNLAGFTAAATASAVPFEAVKATDDHPWEAILRTARSHGCDLVVMASHGRRGISALVLGSETQKVLTHATMPVLVVK